METHNPEIYTKIGLKLAEKYPDIFAELCREINHEESSDEESSDEESSDEESSDEESSDEESSDEGVDDIFIESISNMNFDELCQEFKKWVMANDETKMKYVFQKMEEVESEPIQEVESEPTQEVESSEPTHEVKSEPTQEVENTKPTKCLNTRRCGLCKEIGHYRSNCPKTTHLPMKQTSTWNAKHKEHTISKYKCPCGKQEMNKCNLDRHQRNHNCLKIFA